MKRGYWLIILAILSIVIVILLSFFNVIWVHYESDTVPVVYGGEKLYFVQRVWDWKEQMEGKTVVYAYHFVPQDPVARGYDAVGYRVCRVIMDSWSGCEHNPDAKHLIAVDYMNETLVWVDAKNVVGYMLFDLEISYEIFFLLSLFSLTFLVCILTVCILTKLVKKKVKV